MSSIIGSVIYSSHFFLFFFFSLTAKLGARPSLHLFPLMCVPSVGKMPFLVVAGVGYDTVLVSPSAPWEQLPCPEQSKTTGASGAWLHVECPTIRLCDH